MELPRTFEGKKRFFFTTTQPSLPKEGFNHSPKPSPIFGKGLSCRRAETALLQGFGMAHKLTPLRGEPWVLLLGEPWILLFSFSRVGHGLVYLSVGLAEGVDDELYLIGHIGVGVGRGAEGKEFVTEPWLAIDIEVEVF